MNLLWSDLGEAQCCYCTKLIPAGALNCPSCGKERKELYQVRMASRFFFAGLIISSLLLPVVPTEIFAVVFVPVSVFWVICLWVTKKRYRQISGKEMM
jgi:hypothetical protein